VRCVCLVEAPTVSALWLAQPEVDVLVVQEREAQRHGQQVEEVVVPRQDDQDLQ